MEEWFRDWFNSEDYLEVYQHRDENDARKLLDLILKETNLSNNSVILDSACGAGRHIINLTADGFNCYGFDLSKTLLKKAVEEAKVKSVVLKIFCADIRKVCLKQKFDLIMNLFTSFGYFETDEENFRFCLSAFNMLKGNGIYILDYFNVEYLRKNLLSETIKEIGDKTIHESRSIENERVVKKIVIKSRVDLSSYMESVKLYSKDVLIKQLLKIGFELKSVFGDYDGAEFNEHSSPRLILFLKK
jgi:SAM-dependent methyltransferase